MAIAALALALLLALYAAIGFWVVPRLVLRSLPPWVEQHYGVQLRLGQVDFNPFRFTVEAHTVVLQDGKGAPLLRADKLAVDYAPGALLRRTWSFRDITLDGLHADLVLGKDGKLNLVELLHRLSPSDGRASGEPARFHIDQLALRQATIVFTDLRGPAAASATISPIDFNMAGLSSLAGSKATQTLSATLPDGATLHEQGNLALQPALSANGQLTLQNLHAGHWLPFARNELRIERLEGHAGLAAKYRYGQAQGLQLDELALHVADLLLGAPGVQTPLVTMAQIDATGGSLDTVRRTASFGQLSLARGQVSVSIAPDGRVGWSRLLPAEAGLASATTSTTAPATTAPATTAPATTAPATTAPATTASTPATTASTPATTASAPATTAPAAASHAGGSGWQLRVASLKLDKVGLAYDDRRHQPPLLAGIGSLDGALALAVGTGSPTMLEAGHMAVTAQALEVPAATPAGPSSKIDSVALQGGSLDLVGRRFTAQRVAVQGGQVAVARDTDGSMDWKPAGARSGPAPASDAAGAKPWDVRIDSLQLSQMAAHFTDRAQAKPWQLDVDRVDLGMALQLSVGGATTQAVARDVQARLQAAALTVEGRKAPALALGSASLDGGAFDLAARRLGAERLTLTDGQTEVARDAQGKVVLLDALFAPAPVSRGPSKAKAPPEAPWQYALGTLALQNFAIAAQDRSFSPPMALAGRIDATIHHVANQGGADFDATLRLQDEGGALKATGRRDATSGAVQAHLVADTLALAPLQPLISRYTTLALRSGTAGGDVRMQYQPGGGAALRATGRLHVDKLALDENTQGPFLELEGLDAAQIDFSSDGPRLRIAEVTLEDPVTRIAIAKDRSVNLTEVVRHDRDGAQQAAPPDATKSVPSESAAASPAAAPSAAAPAQAAASTPGFQLEIQSVRVHGGNVDFSDQSLVLPFATKVTAIDANIVGISNDGRRQADVQARGSIQTYGSASVDGNILPFDPRRHTDLRVKFNNVMVEPFSPYTATFAGRKVQSGRLWLDLEYKIDDGELLGKNDVRLANFVLGERVDSPTASNLPLDLAVSLLTDSKGEINLSVPVRGDLDSPHFDLGSTIAKAIANTLGRIITAPFRLLGRLFGGADTSLDNSIAFAPGSAALAPDQRERLDTLTTALQARPLLKLVIHAPYDPKADTQALQQEQARRKLAARLKRPAQGEDGPLPIAFDDPATRAALRALRAETAGQPAATASPAPAGNEDRAAYEAMFAQVAALQPVDPVAIRVLATQRADAIASYLAGHGVARDRLQTGQVQSVQATDKGVVEAGLDIGAAQR